MKISEAGSKWCPCTKDGWCRHKDCAIWVWDKVEEKGKGGLPNKKLAETEMTGHCGLRVGR